MDGVYSRKEKGAPGAGGSRRGYRGLTSPGRWPPGAREGGGQEERMCPTKKEAKRSARIAARALLGGCSHSCPLAAVDVSSKGLLFLLGSEKETEREEGMYPYAHTKDSRGPISYHSTLHPHHLALPPSSTFSPGSPH